MVQRHVASPAAYVAQVPEKQRPLLQAVRAIVRRVAPDVREGIAYGMLDYPGLCNVAAQTQYVAVYTDVAVIASHRHLLPGVHCGKSCIRFRNLQQLEGSGLEQLLHTVRAHRAGERAPAEPARAAARPARHR